MVDGYHFHRYSATTTSAEPRLLVLFHMEGSRINSLLAAFSDLQVIGAQTRARRCQSTRFLPRRADFERDLDGSSPAHAICALHRRQALWHLGTSIPICSSPGWSPRVGDTIPLSLRGLFVHNSPPLSADPASSHASMHPPHPEKDSGCHIPHAMTSENAACAAWRQWIGMFDGMPHRSQEVDEECKEKARAPGTN